MREMRAGRTLPIFAAEKECGSYSIKQDPLKQLKRRRMRLCCAALCFRAADENFYCLLEHQVVSRLGRDQNRRSISALRLRSSLIALLPQLFAFFVFIR